METTTRTRSKSKRRSSVGQEAGSRTVEGRGADQTPDPGPWTLDPLHESDVFLIKVSFPTLTLARLHVAECVWTCDVWKWKGCADDDEDDDDDEEEEEEDYRRPACSHFSLCLSSFIASGKTFKSQVKLLSTVNSSMEHRAAQRCVSGVIVV
ncbi:uncharacterized protein V6R79_005676 [Siganus canaliculatus]